MEDPPTSITPPDEQNFSNVIFNQVEKSYKVNTDIMCSFLFSQTFQPKKKDWIGVFKVGWKTTREYFTWTSAASDQEGMERKIFFKAYYLPKENENYYQFCYVDEKGEVRGASTPFHFTIENKEEDCEILMVITEEEQKRSAKQISELQGSLAQLQIENDSLNNMVSSLKKENLSQTDQIEDLEAKLKTCMNNCEKLELEKKEIQTQLNLERNKKIDEEAKELEKMKKQHELEREQLETNIQILQAELKQIEQSLDTSLMENERIKIENEAQQKDVARLNVDIALKEVVISDLQQQLEEQSQDLECAKKELETLQVACEDQKGKADEKEQEMRNVLKSNEHEILTLQRELDQQKGENETMHSEIINLRCTVHLREVEINELREERKRTNEEMDQLNQEYQRSLRSLSYRNPYQEEGSLTLARDHERQLDHKLECPICQEKFLGSQQQLFDDHMMCHEIEQQY